MLLSACLHKAASQCTCIVLSLVICNFTRGSPPLFQEDEEAEVEDETEADPEMDAREGTSAEGDDG